MLLKNLISNKLTIAIAAVVVLASCQNNKQASTPEMTATDSANMTELSKEVKEVVYPLPTPFEMTKMLSEIGAAYIPGTLNPASKADKYFKEKSKAVNLGIYGADLAYASTYDQKQDVKVYSKVVKDLIDDLGIGVDYSKMLTEEFKEKVNNKDTLTKIVTNTFYDTYKYLNTKSNPDLAIMMVSGMWIELMYIATNISEDTYHYTGLVKIIAGQRDSYNKLMNLLASRNTDPDIKDLETKLLVIKPTFDKIDSGLTEKDYKLILTTIQSVRKSLVN